MLAALLYRDGPHLGSNTASDVLLCASTSVHCLHVALNLIQGNAICNSNNHVSGILMRSAWS